MFAATWLFASNTFVHSMIYLVMLPSVRKGSGAMFRAVCPDDYWKGREGKGVM